MFTRWRKDSVVGATVSTGQRIKWLELNPDNPIKVSLDYHTDHPDPIWAMKAKGPEEEVRESEVTTKSLKKRTWRTKLSQLNWDNFQSVLISHSSLVFWSCSRSWYTVCLWPRRVFLCVDIVCNTGKPTGCFPLVCCTTLHLQCVPLAAWGPEGLPKRKGFFPLITRPVELLAGRVNNRCKHTHSYHKHIRYILD